MSSTTGTTGTTGNSEIRDFRAANKIGSNSNFSQLSLDTIIRRTILLRNLWILNTEELTWVDKIYLKKTDQETFLNYINTDHEWKNRLEFNNKLYDLEFLSCSLESIKEDKEKHNLLLSVRENNYLNFYCMIVRMIDDDTKVPANTKEL